jgi:hypothetical protein
MSSQRLLSVIGLLVYLISKCMHVQCMLPVSVPESDFEVCNQSNLRGETNGRPIKKKESVYLSVGSPNQRSHACPFCVTGSDLLSPIFGPLRI